MKPPRSSQRRKEVGIGCIVNRLCYLPILLFLAGCATTTKHDWSVGPTERGQTFLESKGAQAGKERLAKTAVIIQNREDVRWGGVAVVTENGQALAPMAGAKLEEFQNNLIRSLKGAVNIPGFNLLGLGDALTDNERLSKAPITFMVVIQHERMTTTPVLDTQKVRFDVIGQMIFLDNKSAMQLTAAYPVAVGVEDLGNPDPSELIRMALHTDKKAPDGKAISLVGQVMELLSNEAISPRAVFPPISVLPVMVGSGQVELNIGMFSGSKLQVDKATVPQDVAARWPDELGRTFATFLGANTGLPLNPYTTAGGATALKDDTVLSIASSFTMRQADNQQTYSKLTPPRYLLSVEFLSLTCMESDDKAKRKTFQTSVNYGFDVVVSLKNADTGKEVDRVAIKLEHGGKNLGALARKYGGISEFVLKRQQSDGPVDPEVIKVNLRPFLDEFMLQLAREVAYPEEDLLKRFEKFRALIKRNA